MADPSLHPGASLLGTQDAPAVASPTKANHGNFVLDLVPSTTAAMSIIKSAVEEQAAVYAQEERQRRDLALDREFASKTSDEVLAYLKRHLKPETYNIVFNELGDGCVISDPYATFVLFLLARSHVLRLQHVSNDTTLTLE